MSTLILLVACAGESRVMDIEEPVVAPDVGSGPDDASAPVEPDVQNPGDEPYVSNTLFVETPEGTTGWLELRPFNPGNDDPVGTAMRSVPVTGDVTGIMLPVSQPAGDATGRDAPFLYRIALRADAGNRPGPYIGVSSTSVAWIPANPPPGTEVGWNLAVDFVSYGASWMPISEGAWVDANLAGDDAVTIGGAAVLELSDSTRFAIATSEDADAVAVYDVPLVSSWSATLEGKPRDAAMVDTTSYHGAMLTGYAYEGVQDAKSVMGRLCSEGMEAVVTWFGEARDIDTAVAMTDMGVRSGWAVMVDDTYGPRVLEDDELDALELAPACE